MTLPLWTGHRGPRVWAVCLTLVALPGGPAPAGDHPTPLVPAVETARLQTTLARDRVYLGQSVDVSVTLLLGRVSARDIRYPRLTHPGVRVSTFSAPRRGEVVEDGVTYSAYVFDATLTPTASGELRLGPAELDFDLLLPASGPAAFFGGVEPRPARVSSGETALLVLDLPRSGRPADFTGALGTFTARRQARPRTADVGQAVTVTTVIEGSGNIDRFACMDAAPAAGARAYAPRRQRAPERLTCVQVIVPDVPGTVTLPAAAFSYFAPEAESYRTLRLPPLDISVRAAEPARTGTPSPDSPPSPASVPVDAAADATDAERPPAHFGWPLALALLALSLIAAWVARIRRRRRPTAGADACPPDAGPWLARAEAALRAGDATAFHQNIHRALQAALAARHDGDPRAITVDVLVRPAGVGDDADDAVFRRLFARCDQARYAPAPAHDPEDMAETLRALRALLEKSARIG